MTKEVKDKNKADKVGSIQKEEEKMIGKRKGIVVSDKNDKTIIVEVTTLKTHKKYRKKYRDSRRFKVHDEDNKHKVGDQVEFVETRPISRDKKWKVVN